LTGFCFSILYCTDAGLSFLDVVDFYINFVMLLVGFFETFGAGWCYDILDQLERFGRPAVLSFFTANFGSVLVACGLWFGLKENAVLGGFLALILLYLSGVAVTWYFLKKVVVTDTDKKWTMKGIMWEIYFGNIVALRDRMQTKVGPVPFVWCILIKHFLPHLLIILFINLAQSESESGNPLMGHYGGYPAWPYQVLGVMTFAFTLFIFAFGVVFPNFYAPLALPRTKEGEMELAKYDGKLFWHIFCFCKMLGGVP
jgi:putative solute:sodium symporter small subunit